MDLWTVSGQSLIQRVIIQVRLPGKSEEKSYCIRMQNQRSWEEYELKEDGVYITPVHWGKVEKRTWFSLLVMLLTVPLMLYLSVVLFHGKQYLAMSLIVVFFAMVPFFMVFEGRKPQAREIMVIAVLAAIGVARQSCILHDPQF